MGSPLAAFGDPEIHGTTRTTTTGNLALTDSGDPIQIVTLDQARDVTLPAERAGKMFIISNKSASAISITLKNDAGTALATIAQYQAALVLSDGTGWVTILGAAATLQT